ncbi:hypothetical protein CHU98_g2353 [Xylaria longipes]|nr:hypothetical protein CHU98_g2353 [Xylaria longipes]
MDPSSDDMGEGATTSNVRNIRELQDIEIEIEQKGEIVESYRFDSLINRDERSKIPVASDFRYERFRYKLLAELQIPLDATLYPPQNSGVVNIDSKSSCIIALTQVQGSESIQLGVLRNFLRLTPDKVERPATPQGGKTKPGGVGVPTTPPNPNTQQKNYGPKTADSPGDQSDSDDELKDTPDDKSDDEFDDGTGNNNDVMKHFPFDWPSVDNETWRQVCQFFSCGTDAARIRIEGIRVDIEPYQALAIYKALRQVTEGHFSFIIGDDVGLGKTGMALCITNPSLIPTFVGEAEKWIDLSPDSPASQVRILVAHASYKGSGNFFSREKERLIKPQVDQSGGFGPPRGGGSRNIVIMSNAGVAQFLQRFIFRYNNYDLCAGFIFFDEFHTYKGNRQRETLPFQMLETISRRRRCQAAAIGLSGSARADCAYWRPFIRHAFNAKRFDRGFTMSYNNYDIARLTKVEDFDEYENSWKNLVNNLSDTSLQGRALESRNEMRDKLFEFLKRFIPLMMISRQRGDMFRGVQILGRRNTQLIRCDMQIDATVHIFSLISQVRSLINEEYKIALNDWIGGNREGEKPIKRAFVQTRLEVLSDSPRRNARSTVPQLLLRASTFPAVAQLVRQKSINYEAILGKSVVTIAKRISAILVPDKIDDRTQTEAIDVLSSSTWWQHRDLLYERSPKIKEVERQIDNLIEISTKDADDPSLANIGPPPSDGTTSRHLLLYADYPLSAFLMLMVLFPRYCGKNVVVLYAHSGVDMTTRTKYIDYIQENCNQGDPVKILISTISIIGHGFNIFRASTVIITEIPRSSDKQNQAFGRVDRRGQVMEPKLIQLYDSNNLLEEIRRIRNENRDRLSGVGHDSDSSYPLADLILNDNDDGDGDDDNDDEQDNNKQGGSKQSGSKQGGSKQVGKKQGSKNQVAIKQEEIKQITSYRDEEVQAAAVRAFPSGRFRQLPTNGLNFFCGVRAVIGSIARQYDADVVPVPDEEDLINAIYLNEPEFGYEQYNNFSPDQLQAGLREWARRNGHQIDFRIGFFLKVEGGHVADRVRPLLPEDGTILDQPTIVWICLRTNGNDEPGSCTLEVRVGDGKAEPSSYVCFCSRNGLDE